MNYLHKDDFNDYAGFSDDLYLVNKNQTTSLHSIEHEFNHNQLKPIINALQEIGFKHLIEYQHAPGRMVSQDNQCIIRFQSCGPSDVNPNLDITFVGGYDTEVLLKTLADYKKTHVSTQSKLHLVLKTPEGFKLMEKKLNPVDVPLSNYNLSMSWTDITKMVGSDVGGMMLFPGDPGTGKSYFIRKIIHAVDKKFVYIPVDVTAILADPGFISFAIDELQDSVLIIEDAETVLVDRAKHENSVMSTLLNVTDGLLGELLRLKIIATVNIQENIDKALIRKGRMLARLDFQALTWGQAVVVAERLGYKLDPRQEKYTLAELYNRAGNGAEVEATKIGFKM